MTDNAAPRTPGLEERPSRPGLQRALREQECGLNECKRMRGHAADEIARLTAEVETLKHEHLAEAASRIDYEMQVHTLTERNRALEAALLKEEEEEIWCPNCDRSFYHKPEAPHE